jgi:predicted deacetylase
MRVEQTQILTRGELTCVLVYGKKQAKRSANWWRNLVIFGTHREADHVAVLMYGMNPRRTPNSRQLRAKQPGQGELDV